MFEFKNEAEREVLYMYGAIGEDFWSPEESNRAKDIAQHLDSISPKPLDIRIDSPGGDVYEGFAIASAIQRYEGEVNVYIDGMAASAASYIALMGDTVTMNDFSMFMIHNAWTYTAGNKEELLRTAAQLEGIDNTIAQIISKRSVLELDEVKEAMTAETWYSADDALAAGLCNTVIETESRMAASLDKAFAKRYLNVPSNVQIVDEEETPAPDNTSETETEETPATDPVLDDDSKISHLDSNITNVEAKSIVLGNKVYSIGE